MAIYSQRDALALLAENNILRTKAGHPLRAPVSNIISQPLANSIAAENAALRGESKTPILDSLAQFHAKHGRQPEGEELLAMHEATKPAAAAPGNHAAPQASAAAIASAILDETDRRAAAATLKTRSQFDAMNQVDRNAFMRAGGKLTE